MVLTLAFVLSFWLYGVARSMCETVFFSPTATARGVVLGVALPWTVFLLISMTRAAARGESRGTLRGLGGITLAMFLGSAVSEVSLLFDEARFARETSGATTIYSRPRAWPNGTCSLVFTPGKGMHSTD